MAFSTNPSAGPVDTDGAPSMRFKELFEQYPVSIQRLAPDGRTLRGNKAWEALWHIREGTPLIAFVMSADCNGLRDPQLIESGIGALLARVTRGLIQLDFALLDPMALIGSAVEHSQPLFMARGHVLVIEGDAGGVRIAITKLAD
jgi:hypothetical protein